MNDDDDADAVLVDTRGMRCPWPALRLARAVRAAAGGGHYVVLADDPDAGREIAALAAGHGWRITVADGQFDLWT